MKNVILIDFSLGKRNLTNTVVRAIHELARGV